MTEQARAALEEQHDGPKKHKNDGTDGHVSKKGHSGIKIGHNKIPAGPASSQDPKPSRQPTVEDVPDDNSFISQQGSDGNKSHTTQDKTISSIQPHAEDEPSMLEYCAHIS